MSAVCARVCVCVTVCFSIISLTVWRGGNTLGYLDRGEDGEAVGICRRWQDPHGGVGGCRATRVRWALQARRGPKTTGMSRCENTVGTIWQQDCCLLYVSVPALTFWLWALVCCSVYLWGSWPQHDWALHRLDHQWPPAHHVPSVQLGMLCYACVPVEKKKGEWIIYICAHVKAERARCLIISGSALHHLLHFISYLTF